jgi:hypothetical protein
MLFNPHVHTTPICAIRQCCSILMFITTSICAFIWCYSIHIFTQRLSVLFFDDVQSTCSSQRRICAVRGCCSNLMFITTPICAIRECYSNLIFTQRQSICAVRGCCSIHRFTQRLSVLFSDVVHHKPLYVLFSDVVPSTMFITTPIRAVRRCCSLHMFITSPYLCCSLMLLNPHVHPNHICAFIWCYSIHIFTQRLSVLFSDAVQITCSHNAYPCLFVDIVQTMFKASLCCS